MIQHRTAIIHPEARLAGDVVVGAFAVIGAGVSIGRGCVLHPHVVIGDGASIAEDCEIFPHAVIGREPKGAGATARNVTFERRVTIGDGCSIGCSAVIYYDVAIGAGSLIGDSASIREQCRIGAQCIVSRCVTINYNTVIGDRVKVMDLTHLTGNMIIEDDVFVSTLVGSANDNLVRAGFGDHVIGPKLRRGCVIGAGALLLPATEVGCDATLGAGAVLTKNIPDGETWVGSPARPHHK